MRIQTMSDGIIGKNLAEIMYNNTGKEIN